MELIQGIKERRSIRRFQEKPVPREVLREIVGTAAWARPGKTHRPLGILSLTIVKRFWNLQGKRA